MGTTEKYEEKQEKIAKAAFRLFQKQGFVGTSIKEIADSASIKKALVRYYFPRKDLFEDLFLRRSLDTASEFLEELDLHDMGSYERMFLLGYFELYYVTQHESMAKLGVDILSSREITGSICKTLVGWIRENLAFPENVMDEMTDALTFTLGGAFETIHQKMTDGVPVDLGKTFITSERVFDSILGVAVPNPDAEAIMSPEWLQEKSKEMDKVIFG